MLVSTLMALQGVAHLVALVEISLLGAQPAYADDQRLAVCACTGADTERYGPAAHFPLRSLEGPAQARSSKLR